MRWVVEGAVRGGGRPDPKRRGRRGQGGGRGRGRRTPGERRTGGRADAAGAGPSRTEVELDRRAAIRRALLMAGAGDVVVVAGKGHETVQHLPEGDGPFHDADGGGGGVGGEGGGGGWG